MSTVNLSYRFLIESLLSLIASWFFCAASQSPFKPPREDVRRDKSSAMRFIGSYWSPLSYMLAFGLDGLQLLAAVYQTSYSASGFCSDVDLGRRTGVELTGVGLMIIGGGLRLWCYRELGRFFTFELAIHPNHKLITIGLYSHLRHPSYLGSFLMGAGSLLRTFGPHSLLACFIPSYLRGKIAFSVTMVYCFVSFASRISVEEEMMAGEFGNDWREYRKRTWAVIPFLW